MSASKRKLDRGREREARRNGRRTRGRIAGGSCGRRSRGLRAAQPEAVLSVLEAPAFSAKQGFHFGARACPAHARPLLGAALYVLVMFLLVALQVWRTLHAKQGSRSDTRQVHGHALGVSHVSVAFAYESARRPELRGRARQCRGPSLDLRAGKTVPVPRRSSARSRPSERFGGRRARGSATSLRSSTSSVICRSQAWISFVQAEVTHAASWRGSACLQLAGSGRRS